MIYGVPGGKVSEREQGFGFSSCCQAIGFHRTILPVPSEPDPGRKWCFRHPRIIRR